MDDEDLTDYERLEKLMHEYILPLVSKKLVGAMVKCALNTKELLSMLYDNHEPLYRVFDFYSDQRIEGDHVGNISEGMMTVSEFQVLIEDSGMVGSSGTEINDELTLKEVRQAFAAAQTEIAFGAEEKRLESDFALSHLQLMSYPEFVEGVSRLGALKWEEQSIAIFEKIELAVTAICQIDMDRASGGRK